MKNYYRFTFLSFCLLFFANYKIYAQEALWKSGGTFISVFDDAKTNLLYSTSCLKNPCEALKLSKNVTWGALPKDSTIGGKNPGAVLCKEVLKQRIIYLKDMQGNENTFCVFKDKSFISSSSLSVIADQNQKKDKK